MGVVGAYDRNLELDEILNSVDIGSGAKSVPQRQANAQFNLGLIPLKGGVTGGAAQGLVDAESYVALASNFTLSNVNTAQQAFNTTAAGAITLPVGTYYFEANYMITNTGTTSHTWAVLFGGTATYTIGYAAFGISGTAANTPVAGGLSGFATVNTAVVVTAASTSATEQVNIELIGYLTVTVAGTLIPQVQMSAAPGGAQNMLKGSFFRIWPLASGGLGALGNWS